MLYLSWLYSMRHRNTTGNETKELRQHRLTHTWDIHTKIHTHIRARAHTSRHAKKRETTSAATAKWRETKRIEMNQNRIEILSTDNGCVINFSLLLFVSIGYEIVNSHFNLNLSVTFYVSHSFTLSWFSAFSNWSCRVCRHYVVCVTQS